MVPLLWEFLMADFFFFFFFFLGGGGGGGGFLKLNMNLFYCLLKQNGGQQMENNPCKEKRASLSVHVIFFSLLVQNYRD